MQSSVTCTAPSQASARERAREPLSLETAIFLGAAARADPAAGATAANFIKFRLVSIRSWYTATKFIVKTLQIVLVLALALTSTAAGKKKKPPDVQIVEASARRGESKVSLDGRLRNSGEKPIKALILLCDFMAPVRHDATKQKAATD